MGEQYFVLSASAHVLFTIQRSPHTYSIIMCVCVISRYGGWRSHQAESGCIPARISGATIKIMPPPPPLSSFLSLGARIIIYVGEFYEAHNIELQFICQRHAIKYCAHADLTEREFFFKRFTRRKIACRRCALMMPRRTVNFCATPEVQAGRSTGKLLIMRNYTHCDAAGS
jgi:hypothetical protein